MDSCVDEADQIMFRHTDVLFPKHRGNYMAFTNLLL